MRALGRAETVRSRLAVEVCHWWPWQERPARDAPSGRSGSPGRFLAVTSNPEHPHGLRKWGRRSEKEKSGGDKLATVDHDDGDAPLSSERRQAGNVSLPPRNRLRQEVEDVEGSKAELWPWWIEEWGGGAAVMLERELRVSNGDGGGDLVLSARVGEGVRPKAENLEPRGPAGARQHLPKSPGSRQVAYMHRAHPATGRRRWSSESPVSVTLAD
jgi:hypothetical protein